MNLPIGHSMDVDVALWSDQASQPSLSLQGCSKSRLQSKHDNAIPSQQSIFGTSC